MTMVSAENVTYIYPETGLKAVDSVSFQLEQGEYLAVLGANGSGKSTLARILAGILEPSEGAVSVTEVSGMVFQSPKDQIVAGIVRSDTAFGPENLGLDDREIGRRVRENLSLTGLLEKALDKTLILSAGQKQKLAVAGILALHPGLLILDEATSMIDPPARKELLAFLDRRHGDGHTIIHVTHDMDEAARASRTIVLCEGKKVFDGSPELLFRQELSPWGIHAEPLSLAEGRGQLVPKEEERGSCALFLDDVSFGYSPEREVFSGLSLGVEQGSFTAVMGFSGSGKSTFFELSAGILSPLTGAVYISPSSTAALAMQESENSLFEEFVSDDVAWGVRNEFRQNEFRRNLGSGGAALRERVREAMELTGLPFERFAERKTHTLSGGEKRRAALAGTIALDADIFLFDEPTSALDPAGRALILKTLRGLRDAGKTVVFSTHRAAEALAADRVVVFENGKIIADGPPEAVIRDDGWVENTCSENPLGSENPFGSENQAGSQNCDPSGMVPVSLPKGAALLEGFRRSSEGAYRSLDTPIHRLAPVWKYAVMLFLMICGIAFPLFLLPGAIAGATVYAGLARYPFRKSILSLVKMLPWFLVIMLFQMLLFPDRPEDTVFFRLGFVTLTDRKMLFTITMLLRFAALVTVLSVFVFSTEEAEILYGMEDILKPLSLIGVPVQHAALVTGIVFRFIPLLQEEALYILKAQILRGGTFRGKGAFGRLRAMIPIFIPLMVQTLNRAAALGEALDARYYGSGKRRRWKPEESGLPGRGV